ncbi:MAG: hypothetical protein RLZZ50_1434, partial [Verrucomicrobiota bacterium]
LQIMSEADMNTWSAVRPGAPQNTPSGQWVLYRAGFTPWKGLQSSGGVLKLRALHGSGEVWLDGAKVAEKADPAAGDLTVPLPAAPGPRELTLLLRAGPAGRTGLGATPAAEDASR